MERAVRQLLCSFPLPIPHSNRCNFGHCSPEQPLPCTDVAEGQGPFRWSSSHGTQSLKAGGCAAVLVVDSTHKGMKELVAAKVPILAGTDAPVQGTTYGASLHEELRLLVEAGLSPTQALTAATQNTARAFHLDDRGRIAAGLRADLVLVDCDPTKDITATENIVKIWKRGVLVERVRPE